MCNDLLFREPGPSSSIETDLEAEESCIGEEDENDENGDWHCFLIEEDSGSDADVE